MAIIILISAICYLALSYSYLAPSRLTRIPTMDSTPGGERQQESEQYRDTLRSSNIQGANEANQIGSSFMAVPEGLPEQSMMLSTSKPPPITFNNADNSPAIQPVQLVPEATQTSTRITNNPPISYQTASSVSTENPFHSSILQQMNAIIRLLEIPDLKSVELIAEANGQDMAWSAAPNDTINDNKQSSKYLDSLPAGTILQGELITLINSDVPAPAVVRISSRPLDGQILLGKFTTNILANGVVIEFNKLSTVNGDEMAIQAVALDRYSASGAVRGLVNNRSVERYGPMLVSSFISGFAASAQQPAMNVLNSVNGIISSSKKRSVEDNLIAGASQAANVAASDLATLAPNMPQILIQPGTAIDILFLSPVSITSHSSE